MNKVYLVYFEFFLNDIIEPYNGYSVNRVIKIFNSKEKANNFIKENNIQEKLINFIGKETYEEDKKYIYGMNLYTEEMEVSE